MSVTVSTLVLALLQVTPAAADPATPTTSVDAKTAWLDSAQKAEAVNELVLQAKIAEKKATTAATTAAITVTTTRTAADAAATRVKAADRAVAGYQSRIDQFTNASFRGARLSEVSLMLTANSADDFLDSATTLDRVAADTQQTLQGAVTARQSAKQAGVEAVQAVADAVTAQQAADQAQTEAAARTADVKVRQTELTAKVAEYKKLYNQLSEKERQEAIAAAERARAAEAARLQAQAEAAAAQAAADQAAADQAAAEQAAAEQAAAAQAGAPAAADPAAPAAPRADRGVPRSTPAASSSEVAPKPVPTSEPPAAPAPSSQAQIAVQAALSKVGSAYVYGAAGPDAFDCSGLTSWAWAQAGVSIPHSSAAQAGYTYVPMDQLQPGDLVTYYSPVSHVALYIGNGQVVHASTESRPVYVTGVYDAGPSPSGHRVLG